MRTGAIFARGSCRALKWMALVGVVFALGGGQVAAQVKTGKITTVAEGGRLEVKVTPEISVPASNDGSADLTVTVTPTFAVAEQIDATKLQTVAEAPDITTTAVTLTWDVPANTSTEDPSSPSLPTKTATFQIGTDLDAEDERITVTVAVSSAASYTNKGTADTVTATTNAVQHITITDTDDQEFVWDVTTATPTEGADIMVTLTADPALVDLEYDVAMSVNTVGYSVSPNTFQFDASEGTAGEDGPSASLTISTPESDENRVTDMITVNVFTAGTAGSLAAPLSIDVADIHALPMADKITAKAYTDDDGKPSKTETMAVMEGGDPVHVTVTVDRGTKGYPKDEELKVSVMADGSQASDYRVDPPTITIGDGTGEKKATFKLWALADEDIGEENLMLTLTAKGADSDDNGPGEVMKMFSIAIEDDTQPWVRVKDGAYDTIMMALGDDPLNPEDEVMIMTDDLFMYDADMYSVSFAASVEGAAARASSSGEAVTVTAMEAGEAKITVTATAAPMSSSLVITQDRANVAQVTFPVSVVMSDLSVSVTAEPMEIMEGGMSTITAMASREVAAGDSEVKVDLQVIGDGDLSASSITIMAGEMMGTATVTATEDDDDYEDETLTVVASGAGSATLTIMVTDNDEAPEPTNAITAKSSDDIYPLLMEAGLAGDDAMFNPGMTAELDASMMFDVMEGYSASYAAESDAMNVASASTMGSMVSVMAGEAGMAHVTITATATMASGVMPGQPAANVATVMFPVNVTDMPLAITVSTDPMDMVEEGGTITVTATANRDVVADDGDVEVTLTITGAVEMNEATIAIAAGSSNSTMVQVLDDMEVAPMADITIVATGSGIVTAQTFTISVTENDSARTFTLSGPEDMNLVEGMEYELTVTADPAVSADTEVMIMRDRSASTADDSDYMVENITIMAGETSGSTMLMVTEDEMDDSGAHMNEVLVLFATADNTQTNSLEFNLWDAAVPALPVIAQLLLAAFLAIGGYRRYLRR